MSAAILRRLGVAACLVVLVLFAAPAQSDEGAEVVVPASIDALYELYGIGNVPADFIFVVDTSGSMSGGPNPPYPQVLAAYNTFLGAIPDGDNLSVITFNRVPSLTFQSGIDAQTREQARPALPPVADGGFTDIGQALDAALQRSERPDASAVQVVIFLTDGLHSPPPGSPFPSTTGPAWDALAARAAQVKQGRELIVLGIGLGDQGEGGAQLLLPVYGSAQITRLPPEQLPAFFQEAVLRAKNAKLALKVNEDVARGVVEVPRLNARLDKVMDVPVDIENKIQKLPVDVTVTGVTATDVDGVPLRAELVGSNTVRIGPESKAPVTVRIFPGVEPDGFTVPETNEEKKIDVQLAATFQALPADILATIQPPPTSAGQVTGSTILDASRTYGWSVLRALVYLAILAVILWILAKLYKRYLWLPTLVGGFQINDRNAGPENGKWIPLKGKRMMLDGSKVVGAKTSEVRLFTRRRHVGRVFAEVAKPKFDRKQGPYEWQPVESVTELQMSYTYRLGGTKITYQSQPVVQEKTATTVAAE